MGTWLWPPGRAVWDSVDHTLFRLLNSLLDIQVTQRAWACVSHRYFDLLGVLAFGVLLVLVARSHRPQLKRACLSVGLLALLAVSLKGASNTVIAIADSRLDRQSPSLVEPGARRLSSLVPEIKAKDASRWSFPGDHGILILTILIYLGYRGSPGTIRRGCLLASIWIAPRLVSGAHWFSDIAVGSLTFALIGTALLMATPLHDWLISKLAGRAE
jgi:membrane-associated phospholipid phosphatase